MSHWMQSLRITLKPSHRISLHPSQIWISSHNYHLLYKLRNQFLLANRSEYRWCGLLGLHTFLSETLHSHISLNNYCCGRTSRGKEKSVAGAWQVYIAISCLSWSIYTWSRQITHKGQGEMWSRQSLHRHCRRCRRPGPKTCFLFCDKSQDLVFPNQGKWKHEAEHSWARKDRKK